MPRRRLLRSKRTHPSKTHMFNPLTAVLRSSMKRKGTAFPEAVYQKGKRARASTTTRGTTRNAVSRMPKDRIGANAGLIVSNQKCPRPKRGSVQYRRTVFGASMQRNKVWIGGSSIGQLVTHFHCLAHTILAYYLPKFGDIRTSNEQDNSAIFTDIQVRYSKDNPSNNHTGAGFFQGADIAKGSLTSMAVLLGNQMKELAREGYYPLSVSFFDRAQAPDLLIYRDQALGRNVITMAIKGKFRFQNVTAAGSGDHSTNINAVDASPLNGKIYTFRNQAPLFASTYTSTQSTVMQDAVEVLQNVAAPFEMYGNTHSAGGGADIGGKGGAAFDHIPAPPLNPKSIWRNVSTTGTAVFPPGGFKTFNTSYLRSETVAKYCQAITQQDLENYVTYAATSQYPPAGDSFMMCLRPTLKVYDAAGGELLKVAYNAEHIMTCQMKKRKPSALQVVNLIE